MDYKIDTKDAYRNKKKAEAYHKYLAKDFSWAHFMMWRERKCVSKALQNCFLKKDQIILDFPCGTGIFSEVLLKTQNRIATADISIEMMEIAGKTYNGNRFIGFTQADITKIPYKNMSISCIMVIGLMHRIPPEIKINALKELTRVSKRYLVVSYTVDNLFQKLKKDVMSKFIKRYIAAPCTSKLEDISESFIKAGLKIKKVYRPFPFLSSETIFLLEKFD